MKPFRKLLRYWIAIASVFSFLVGWVILAHSPKPVSLQSVNVQAAALPNLPPIQAYGTATGNGPTFFSNNGQTSQAAPQTNILQPSTGGRFLRTRGS